MNVETTAEWRKPGSEARDPDARRTDLAFLDFIWTRRTLTKAGRPIKLTPKETLVLGLLLSRAGQVVSISDLITGGWGDEPVGPESLNRCLSGLRRKVPDICEHLQTHHRLGYCLDIKVRPLEGAGPIADTGDARAVVELARSFVGLHSAECCAAALRVLRNAHEAGISSVEIHAEIAEIEFARVQFGHAAPKSGALAAMSAARQALSVDPLHARALSVTGMLRVVVNRDLEGLAQLDRAGELAPGDYEILFRRFNSYSAAGLALPDPVPVAEDLGHRHGEDYGPKAIIGISRLIEGRLEEARDVALRGISLFPYDHRSLLLGAMIENRLGDHETAIEYARLLCETRSRGSGQSEAILAFVLHHGGYVAEAEEVLGAVLGESRKTRPSAFLAVALHRINGVAAAEEMVAKAIAVGCPHLHWIARAAGIPALVDPRLLTVA